MLGLGQLLAKAKHLGDEPKFWRRFHAAMTPLWFLLIIPTMIWWRDSVAWVGLISCYANAVGHFSAYQGSRAEESEDDD